MLDGLFVGTRLSAKRLSDSRGNQQNLTPIRLDSPTPGSLRRPTGIRKTTCRSRCEPSRSFLVPTTEVGIAQAEIGKLLRWGYDSLEAELASIINDPDLAFDQARITADPRLMCSELGRVIKLL